MVVWWCRCRCQWWWWWWWHWPNRPLYHVVNGHNEQRYDGRWKKKRKKNCRYQQQTNNGWRCECSGCARTRKSVCIKFINISELYIIPFMPSRWKLQNNHCVHSECSLCANERYIVVSFGWLVGWPVERSVVITITVLSRFKGNTHLYTRDNKSEK